MPRIYTLTQDRAPTSDELRRILTHTNARGKALITLLASSGMRIGEALSLRVKDLDFTKTPTTIRLRAEVTKARLAWYCFLSNEAATLLRDFLVERIDDAAFVASIESRQTTKLFAKFKELFSSEIGQIEPIQRVILMTPENIHLNAFMYEPILDMSDNQLKRLYFDITELCGTV